jgi:hypothetical protein
VYALPQDIAEIVAIIVQVWESGLVPEKAGDRPRRGDGYRPGRRARRRRDPGRGGGRGGAGLQADERDRRPRAQAEVWRRRSFGIAADGLVRRQREGRERAAVGDDQQICRRLREDRPADGGVQRDQAARDESGRGQRRLSSMPGLRSMRTPSTGRPEMREVVESGRSAWSAIKAGFSGKAIVPIGADPAFADAYGLAPGRQDGDNFRRNMVTLAEYDDYQLGQRSAAIGLAATWACYPADRRDLRQAPAGVFRTAPTGRGRRRAIIRCTGCCTTARTRIRPPSTSGISSIRRSSSRQCLRGEGIRDARADPRADPAPPDAVTVRRDERGHCATAGRRIGPPRRAAGERAAHSRPGRQRPGRRLDAVDVPRFVRRGAERRAGERRRSCATASGRRARCRPTSKFQTPEQRAEAER